MTTKRHIGHARALRQRQTDVERLLWARLRNRQIEGAKFRRQVPIAGYVADLVCEAARLVIELDGGQHAGSAPDIERTAAIEAAGYVVLRFWNNDLLSNTDGVLGAIALTIRQARL